MIFEYILLLVLTILAAIFVIWYFVMRRKLIKFMKYVTEELEKAFKPVDKTYRLLGYLVGYNAKYVLESGDKVYILFTTVPRHSFTYYLLARYAGRADRLELAYENSRRYVPREVHFVLESDKRSQQVVLRDLGTTINKFSKTTLEINSKRYIVYYEDPRDVEKTTKILSSSNLNIRRLSAYTANNLVEVVVDVTSENVRDAVRLLREFNKLMTREKAVSP